jgi:hypothetical protein
MALVDVVDQHLPTGEIGDLPSIVEILDGMSATKIIDLLVDLYGALPGPHTSKGAYRYVGNSELSGLPYPCGSFQCRGRRVSEISTFAAMYADEVTLFNPISNFRGKVPSKKTPARRRRYLADLAFTLGELISIAPLIDREIITFIDLSKHNYCHSCFARGLAAAAQGKEFDDDESKDPFFFLMESYLNRVKVTYDGKSKGVAAFTLKSDSELLGHEMGGFRCDSRSVGNDFVVGQELSREQALAIGVPRGFAHFSSNDLVQSHYAADKYLIDGIITSSGQFDVIKGYFKTGVFGEAVDVRYPFLAGLDVSRILKFRDDEWDHLYEFRKTVEEGKRRRRR